MADKKRIYVLELKDGCFYVGMSDNPSGRWQSHCLGKGSKWTQVHKPISFMYELEFGNKPNPYNLKYVTESTVTYHLMKQHGINKVRGSGWVQVNFTGKIINEPKNFGYKDMNND